MGAGSTTSAFAATADRCSEQDYAEGLCATAGVVGGGVEIGATAEVHGNSGTSSENFQSPTDGAAEEAEDESWCVIPRVPCLAPEPAEVAASGPVTISAIATFRPQPPAAGMQPNQWMIVGLDTNFYANASAHVVDGTLFGGTAQVRFTPTSYNWDYGDGSTASTSNPGKTWAKYRIAEFDPTPTSHVFEEPGNYTISLAVTYAAEYRVAGSSWQNVVGTLTIVAPPLTATAGHATTVLVDQDCIANPTGIGC
ncbi:hypothetical protein I6E81_09985 [Salinibacterium sp. NG22]|nr:hypothetical protein [Salinibacterium sp. NG22]